MADLLLAELWSGSVWVIKVLRKETSDGSNPWLVERRVSPEASDSIVVRFFATAAGPGHHLGVDSRGTISGTNYASLAA